MSKQSEIENMLDRFVDFIIIENCQGCKECEPRLSEQWSNVVCVDKGFANWIMHEAEIFKTNLKK